MSNYPGRREYMECAQMMANMAEIVSEYMKLASKAILDMDRMIHECDSMWRSRCEELQNRLDQLEGSE